MYKTMSEPYSIQTQSFINRVPSEAVGYLTICKTLPQAIYVFVHNSSGIFPAGVNGYPCFLRITISPITLGPSTVTSKVNTTFVYSSSCTKHTSTVGVCVGAAVLFFLFLSLFILFYLTTVIASSLAYLVV